MAAFKLNELGQNKPFSAQKSKLTCLLWSWSFWYRTSHVIRKESHIHTEEDSPHCQDWHISSFSALSGYLTRKTRPWYDL